MRIAVIGAAGNVGSRVVAEALRRGHQVTALTRDQVDATDASTVAALVAGHDAAVGATRPTPGDEAASVQVTRALLDAHAKAGVRLVMVGGAGSLRVPGTDQLVADDRSWVPAEYADLARTGAEQLELCRAATETDWTYVTPAALTEPGLRTGHYAVGGDELIIDATGRSYISMEDLAVAVVDELEQPAHSRRRFAVASP